MKLLSFKSKPEAVPSKEKHRPVLTHLYLRITEENGERVGTLEATDSYKAVMIPVELEDEDTEGFVTIEALKQARKDSPRGTVRLSANGGLVTPEGTEFSRPEAGQWPRLPELVPQDTTEFEIGLSAKFLYEMAQAYGDDRVRIKFTASTDGSPNPMRVMHVRPLNGEGEGILMPIRLAG
jgi:hypothetical protein